MSTPPGQYDTLDAITAAAVPTATPLAETPDTVAETALSSNITWGMQGEPSVAMRGVYITPDDTIVLSARNSNAALTSVIATLRILNPDGNIQTAQITLNGLSADRTANVGYAAQMAGMLTGVMISPPAIALSRGQTYVTVVLVRGGVAHPLYSETLVSDYLSSGFQPSWPEGQLRAPTDGAGYIYPITGAMPLPGTPASIVQPALTRWRPLSMSVSGTTSISVGAREFYCFAQFASTLLFESPAVAEQTASELVQYTCAVAMPAAAPNPASQTMPLPGDFRTLGGTSYEANFTSRLRK